MPGPWLELACALVDDTVELGEDLDDVSVRVAVIGEDVVAGPWRPGPHMSLIWRAARVSKISLRWAMSRISKATWKSPDRLSLCSRLIAWWSALQRMKTKKSPTMSDHLNPSTFS